MIHFLEVASWPKKYTPKSNDEIKKNSICQIVYLQKFQKVLMKIDEMADVFLNLANFVQHAFFYFRAT